MSSSIELNSSRILPRPVALIMSPVDLSMTRFMRAWLVASIWRLRASMLFSCTVDSSSIRALFLMAMLSIWLSGVSVACLLELVKVIKSYSPAASDPDRTKVNFDWSPVDMFTSIWL